MADELQTMAEVELTVRTVIGPFLKGLSDEEIFKSATDEVITKLGGVMRGAECVIVGDPKVTKVMSRIPKKDLQP